jgi:1-acyl-sn-glycerol-3-phosphate acyltransferase
MLVLRSFAFNVLFYCWSAFIQILCLPTIPLSRDGVSWVQRTWIRGNFALLAAICGLRFEVRGLERLPSEPCIIAAKHQSAWDTMIFALLIRRPGYVFKRELYWIPVFGWYMLRAGGISIDRKGGARSLKRMIGAARQTIAEGRHIVIFPEGTRVAVGERLPYHPGVAALYTQLKVPVVPVALNSGLFWGRRTFLKKPGRIVLEFLEPIPPGLRRREFLEVLGQRIEPASEALAAEGRAGSI